MSETQVGFLIKAVSTLTQNNCNSAQNVLKSYYLMRCRELTKGFGLPEKYFSSKLRCPRCFIEWEKGTETKVQSIKLSKKQRRRIRQIKINKSNKEDVEKRKELLESNKVEQICTFCKNTTATIAPKPSKCKVMEKVSVTESMKDKDSDTKVINKNKVIGSSKAKVVKNISNQVHKPIFKKTEMNVYSKSKEAFSLQNKNNTLQGVVKQNKVIQNNKRKKDKFAGLCQQAVLAAAKLKEEKKSEKKLNLFLKPSS